MLFNEANHFYHASIRRYIALFGSLFTDMVIKRKTPEGREDIVRVPIKYGNQSVYMSVAQDSSRDNTQISRILPAMAFELTNFYKDVSRKTNPMVKLKSKDTTTNNWQFNRVPYNFIFTLYIRTKNIEDALQIVEQIVPAFDGNLSVTIQDIPNEELDIEQDIKIKLQEVEYEDNYQDEMKNRLIDYTITFELAGYLYKKTNTSFVVREVDIYSLFDYGEGLQNTTLIDHREVPVSSPNDNLSKLHNIVDSNLFDTTPKVQPSRKKSSRKKR